MSMLRSLIGTAVRPCRQLVAGKRSITGTATLRCQPGQAANPSHAAYQPNNLERRFLVWTGKYKTIAEVPAHVSRETMERSRNKMRIRIANLMMLATVFGCIAMVYSGKKASGRGESVVKMNLDWHKQYNDDAAAAATTEATKSETTAVAK